MAVLTNLRKLVIGLFASAAVAGPVAYVAHDYFVSAPASTFAVIGSSVQAGNHLGFTVTRTSGSGFAVLTFVTHNGTAHAGMDYVPTVKTVVFSRTQRTATIYVQTLVDPASLSNLTFTATIQYGSSVVSTATGTIVKGSVSPPAPPATQVCPDGSTILASATCPALPTPSYVVSPTLAGLADVPDNFDYNTALQPSWGTGAIPSSASPDVLGAFRFICTFDKFKADDPLVYPGQPGKSHMHNFYGNEGVDANSTFNSLRTTGGSSCNYFGDGTKAANRSGYWIPGMDDGKSHWVQPDYSSIYYKRRPASDPVVSNPANSQYMGQAEPIPNGLRFIFGFNMLDATDPPTGSLYFNCQGTGSIPGHYDSIDAVVAANACPAGTQLGFIIEAPSCWDGQYVDTPNHRTHMAYPSYGNWGYLKCDSGHPYVIPQFTLGTWYSVQAGDDLSLWHFASDEMHPELAHGKTGHADYFEAWSNPVKAMWEANCINLKLNCSGGDLGNGLQLKGASIPTYIIGGVPVTSWTNPNRLVNKGAGPVLAGVLSEGDSISVYWAGNHTGLYASAHHSTAFFGDAVGGSTISSMNGRFTADSASNPRVVTILIGANDLANTTAYPTTTDWLNALWAYTAQWKATGAKVVVATVLPQCNATLHNSRRATVNTAIRAAVGNQINAVADFGGDATMGPDAAACDTNLYKDGLHPTDNQTANDGQHKLAVIYTTAVDSL